MKHGMTRECFARLRQMCNNYSRSWYLFLDSMTGRYYTNRQTNPLFNVCFLDIAEIYVLKKTTLQWIWERTLGGVLLFGTSRSANILRQWLLYVDHRLNTQCLDQLLININLPLTKDPWRHQCYSKVNKVNSRGH